MATISFKLMKLVRDCPLAVLPLSLMCCNFGAMWNAAATNLEALKALQPDLARLADVANAMAIALQVVFIMRCCGRSIQPRGVQALATESQTPPFLVAYSTALMALLGVASWIYERNLLTLAIVLWVFALVVFFLLHALFLRVVVRLASSPPRNAEGGGAASPSRLRKLFTALGPPWIVPLVGLASAAATGGGLIRASTAVPGLQRLALLTPLCVGALWALAVFPAAWAAVLSRRKLCTDPTVAILCAPPSLLLAGLLGAEPMGAEPLAHLLALLALLSTPPVAMASMATCLLPTTPFNPAMAACGFPMEIVTIALLRYRATLLAIRGGADEFRTLAAVVGVLAWVQLTIATLVVLAIVARFSAAAWRAAARTWRMKAVPIGAQSAAAPVGDATMSSATASDGSPPAAATVDDPLQGQQQHAACESANRA